MSKLRSIFQKREKLDPFNLSFLDIISCGFGAVVMLILIFRFDPSKNEVQSSTPQTDNPMAYASLMAEASLIQKIEHLRTNLENLYNKQAANNASQKKLAQQLSILQRQINTQQANNEEKKKQLAGLINEIEHVKVAGTKTEVPKDPDEEVGGILVDRDYVIFIVDTSGSMRKIWRRISSRMTEILQQHPKVKGIQIMNDNGSYLVSGYAKRWIPDTPKMREHILKLFSLWSSTSNSSPFEGIVRALKDFQSSTPNMSIYVLGDDYTGSDFDGVIEKVRKLNKGGARINAINFINPSAATDRFSILMREIALENHGTLITM